MCFCIKSWAELHDEKVERGESLLPAQVEPSSCGLLEEDIECDISWIFHGVSEVEGGVGSIVWHDVFRIGNLGSDVDGIESAVMSSFVVSSKAVDGGVPPAGHHREGSIAPTGHHLWVVLLM